MYKRIDEGGIYVYRSCGPLQRDFRIGLALEVSDDLLRPSYALDHSHSASTGGRNGDRRNI